MEVTLKEKKLPLPTFTEPSDLDKAALLINQLGKNINEHAYIVGRVLIWVKLKLKIEKKESFDNWIVNNIWFDIRTAQNYMKFATRCNERMELLIYSSFLSKKRNNFAFGEDNTPIPINITLLEGDLFNEVSKIPDKSIDLLITDPPYWMDKEGWDEFESKEDFIRFTKDWIKIILRKLKDKYNIFISFNSNFFADLELICRELGLPIQSRLIWHYRNAGGKSSGKFKFSKTYEPILHIGNKELNFDQVWSDERFDVWTIAVPQSNFAEGKFHPTQKPKELFERLIKIGSSRGETVLDCFAGSGTTGVVCKNLDRSCVLIEKEPKYINVIKNTINVR